MCQVSPIIYACCLHVYVEVVRMPSCPADWPHSKCPEDLCLQIGSVEPRLVNAICWRCQSDKAKLNSEQRRSMIPALDYAPQVVGLAETQPEDRKKMCESKGVCWYCNSRVGCYACGAAFPWDRKGLVERSKKEEGVCFYCTSRAGCQQCGSEVRKGPQRLYAADDDDDDCPPRSDGRTNIRKRVRNGQGLENRAAMSARKKIKPETTKTKQEKKVIKRSPSGRGTYAQRATNMLQVPDNSHAGRAAGGYGYAEGSNSMPSQTAMGPPRYRLRNQSCARDFSNPSQPQPYPQNAANDWTPQKIEPMHTSVYPDPLETCQRSVPENSWVLQQPLAPPHQSEYSGSPYLPQQNDLDNKWSTDQPLAPAYISGLSDVLQAPQQHAKDFKWAPQQELAPAYASGYPTNPYGYPEAAQTYDNHSDQSILQPPRTLEPATNPGPPDYNNGSAFYQPVHHNFQVDPSLYQAPEAQAQHNIPSYFDNGQNMPTDHTELQAAYGNQAQVDSLNLNYAGYPSLNFEGDMGDLNSQDLTAALETYEDAGGPARAQGGSLTAEELEAALMGSDSALGKVDKADTEESGSEYAPSR